MRTRTRRLTHVAGGALVFAFGGALVGLTYLSRTFLGVEPWHAPDYWVEFEIGTSPPGFGALTTEAWEAEQASDCDRAVRLYEEAVVTGPSYPAPHAVLAEAYLAGDALEAALASYRAAEAMSPKWTSYFSDFTGALLRSEYPVLAVTLRRELAERYPDRAAAQADLGEAYAENHDWSHAVEAYEAALRLRPHRADWYLALGEAYDKQGCSEDARRSFAAAARYAPYSAEHLTEAGDGLLSAGAFADAEVTYRRAVQLDSKDLERPWAMMGLARSLRAQGRDAEAADWKARGHRIEILQSWQWVQRNPDSHYAHAALALRLVQAGRRTDAIPVMRYVRDLDPQDPWNTATLFRLLDRLGNADAARAECEAAIATFNTRVANGEAFDVSELIGWGDVLARAERVEAAQAAYERAIALDPEEPAARSSLGDLLLDNGRWDEAITAYMGVLDLPEAEQFAEWRLLHAYFGISMAYARLGRSEDAELYAQRAWQTVEALRRYDIDLEYPPFALPPNLLARLETAFPDLVKG